MKRWISTAVLGAMVCALSVGSVNAATAYSDISSHWASSAIMEATFRGYVSGYDDGTFRPDKPVSRLEFLIMMARAQNLYVPDPEALGQYSKALVDQKIYSYGELGPTSEPLTRIQMVRLMAKMLFPGYRGNPSSDEVYLYELTAAGILTGSDNGSLDLESPVTRGQAVTILNRTFMNQHENPVDKKAASNAEMVFRKNNMQTMLGPRGAHLPLEMHHIKEASVVVDQIMVSDLSEPSPVYGDVVPPDILSRYGGSNNYLFMVRMNISTDKMLKLSDIYNKLEFGSNISFASTDEIKSIPEVIEAHSYVAGYKMYLLPKESFDESVRRLDIPDLSIGKGTEKTSIIDPQVFEDIKRVKKEMEASKK